MTNAAAGRAPAAIEKKGYTQMEMDNLRFLLFMQEMEEEGKVNVDENQFGCEDTPPKSDIEEE